VLVTLAMRAASGYVPRRGRDKHKLARSRTISSRTRDPARRYTRKLTLLLQKTLSTAVAQEGHERVMTKMDENSD
jgi:hypothetical protein